MSYFKTNNSSNYSYFKPSTPTQSRVVLTGQSQAPLTGQSPAPSSLGNVIRTTPSGYRDVSYSVFDQAEYDRFAAQKQAEAKQKELGTVKRVKEFESQRLARLSKEELARRKQLIGKERITVKQPTRLTQARKAPSYELFVQDIKQKKYVAAVDVQKTSEKEYGELNKEIEKINKELQEYKPMKTLTYRESATYYVSPEGKKTLIDPVQGQQYATAVKEYKAEIERIQNDLAVGQSTISSPVKQKSVYDYFNIPQQKVFETYFDTSRVAKPKLTISGVVAQGNLAAQIARESKEYSDIQYKLTTSLAGYGIQVPSSGILDLNNLQSTRDYTPSQRIQIKQELESLFGKQEAITTRIKDVARDNRITPISLPLLDYPTEQERIRPVKGDWLGGYAFDLETQRQKFEREVSQANVYNINGRQIGFPSPQFVASSFIQGTLEGVTGLGLIGQDIVFGGGQKTGKAVSRIVSDPLGTGGEIVGSAVSNPFRFTGSLVGSFGTFKVAGKLGSLVVKAGQIGLGKVTAFGKTKISIEKLVPKEVLLGKKSFPELIGSGDDLIRITKKGAFTKSISQTDDIVLHGTDWRFTPFKREFIVGAGRGLEKSVDVPVMYTSGKGLSLHFLRFGNKSTSYSLFPNFSGLKGALRTGSPKILAVYPKSIGRIPSVFRTSLGKAQSYFGKFQSTGQKAVGKVKAPLDRAIPTPAFEFGLKKEAELGLAFGGKWTRTNLSSAWEKLTGFRYYTQYKPQGAWFTRNIPIYEVTPSLGKSIGKIGSSVKSFGSAYDVSGYSSGAYNVTKSYLTWSGLGSLSVIPLKSSKSSVVSKSYFVSPLFGSSGVSKSTSRTSSVSVPSGSSLVSPYKQSSYTGSSINFSPSITSPSYVSKSSFSLPSMPSYSSINKPSIIGGGRTTIPKTIPRQRKEDLQKSYDDKTQLYHAFVRRNNNTKWVRVTEKPKPRNMAYNKGFYVADNSVAVSVKIKPSGRARQFVPDDFGLNIYKFREKSRRSRVPDNPVYQEVTDYRIDTIGEKKGLSAAKYMKEQKQVNPFNFMFNKKRGKSNVWAWF